MEQLGNQLATGLSLSGSKAGVVSYEGKGMKLNSEDDAQPIVDELNGCKDLTTLVLSGNTVGPGAAKAIGQALKQHAEFKHAKWSDMFTGKLKTEIPPALISLSDGVMGAQAHLVELDLSDNAFGALGVDGIVTLLQSQSCFSLQELRLNNNGLGITGGQLLAKTLLECYEKSLKANQRLALKVFVSGRNRLENEGSTALAHTFEVLGSLEEVSMPQNGIHYPGIRALADAFRKNKNLRTINLSDNTFTYKGAKAMAEAIPNNDKLEYVNFESCLTRSSGAKVLTKALAKSVPNLKELNLRYNEINEEAGVELVEILSGKPSLTSLLLGGNNLRETGIEAVTDVMRAAGKEDILGSFSEDEGTGDEEEPDSEFEEDQGDGQQEMVTKESEDKKFRPVTSDLYGPLVLLKHVISLRKITKQSADILYFFLSKDNKQLDAHFGKKNELLQELFCL